MTGDGKRAEQENLPVILLLQVTTAHDLVSCSKAKTTSAFAVEANSVTPAELLVSIGTGLESRDLTSTNRDNGTFGKSPSIRISSLNLHPSYMNIYVSTFLYIMLGFGALPVVCKIHTFF